MVSCRRTIAASVTLVASLSRRGFSAMASAGHHVRREKGTIVVEPAGGGATATVILMHGLGDTADGWESSATDFFGPALPHARFILPTAASRPITVNGGMAMPGWYDIEALGSDLGAPAAARARERAEGIISSRKRITSLIKAERDDGIPANRIVLAGFSQGGAMSLFTGLNFPGAPCWGCCWRMHAVATTSTPPGRRDPRRHPGHERVSPGAQRARADAGGAPDAHPLPPRLGRRGAWEPAECRRCSPVACWRWPAGRA